MIQVSRSRLLRLAAHWHRLVIPALLLVIFAVVGGFLELADEIGDNETREFDERVLLSMRTPGDTADPFGPPGIEEAARDLTALGGLTLLALVTTTAFGIAMFAGKRRLAWAGLASVLVGSAITRLLKHGYQRPRPDLVEHGTWLQNPSFPSGHSMMAAVVYLTLGILLARTQPKKRVRLFIMAVSIFVTVLVGISRVYLGVHWPTDVVAGWMLGGAWAVIFWLVAMKIDPRLSPS